MADITMCKGKNCDLAKYCYRYNAISCVYAQSYFIDKNVSNEDGSCDCFWLHGDIYKTMSHEDIRGLISRGGRGKDNKQPLKYVLVKGMSNSWLHKVIEYETERRPNNPYLSVFIAEVKYREDNNIFIKDEKEI